MSIQYLKKNSGGQNIKSKGTIALSKELLIYLDTMKLLGLTIKKSAILASTFIH